VAAEVFCFARANFAEVEQAQGSLLAGACASPSHLDLAQLFYSVYLNEARVSAQETAAKSPSLPIPEIRAGRASSLTLSR